MKIFLDSANIDEIREMLPFIDGVTTNPSLLKSWDEAKEIIKLCGNKPVSVEVTTQTTEEMVKEGKEFTSWGDNIVVKLPCTEQGLLACQELSLKTFDTNQYIKTNVTLIFTREQALLAANCGATYISPFIGRLNNYKATEGIILIWQIANVFKAQNIKTKILGASIHTMEEIGLCAAHGYDCVTLSPKILKEMFNHPLTDQGLKKFMDDWNDKTR